MVFVFCVEMLSQAAWREANLVAGGMGTVPAAHRHGADGRDTR